METPTQTSVKLTLPFAIDETDFSLWLSALPQTNPTKCCELILQVLQTLNKTYLAVAGKTRLHFLQKLGAQLFEFTEQLTTDPYSIEKSKSYLAIWSCAELANAYSLLSDEKRFAGNDYYSQDEQQQIIILGFQAMAKALLYTAQAYAKPYLYFWIKCYQLYQKAQHNLMTGSDAESAMLSVDQAFKHILVFSLSNTNQFTPREMKLIHHYLQDYAVHARLLTKVPEKKFFGTPYFNLKNDQPPILALTDHAPADKETIYIATVTVSSKILDSLADKDKRFVSNDRALLKRLAKILTLNRHRRHQREQDRSQHFGIIGFENLVSFYCQQQAAIPSLNVGQLDLNHPGELRELNFEILPHEEKLDAALVSVYNVNKIKQMRRNNPAEIWNHHKKTEFEANATQIDKSEAGYGLIWQDKSTEPRVGDLIGIQNQKPSIGIIRWIAKSPSSVLLFGVELLGFSMHAVKINSTGYGEYKTNAVYLANKQLASKPIESIICDHEFKLTEYVYIHSPAKAIRYRLVKLLNSTPLLRQLEIVKA